MLTVEGLLVNDVAVIGPEHVVLVAWLTKSTYLFSCLGAKCLPIRGRQRARARERQKEPWAAVLQGIEGSAWSSMTTVRIT